MVHRKWMEAELPCQGATDLFFAEESWAVQSAKNICAGCWAKALCLRYAFDLRIRVGVYGGTSGNERVLAMREAAKREAGSA